MLEKCVLTILELNWNQRQGHKKTKLNICHHMPTSSTQLQNRSFHVVERTRTSSTCQKMENARAKRAKILFLIVKYVNLWGPCCRRRCGCLSSLISRSPCLAHRAPVMQAIFSRKFATNYFRLRLKFHLQLLLKCNHQASLISSPALQNRKGW